MMSVTLSFFLVFLFLWPKLFFTEQATSEEKQCCPDDTLCKTGVSRLHGMRNSVVRMPLIYQSNIRIMETYALAKEGSRGKRST